MKTGGGASLPSASAGETTGFSPEAPASLNVVGPVRGSTEDALEVALRAATEAKQWDLAGMIVTELRERRLAADGVVTLPVKRAGRGRIGS